jgi:hypothetical protein
MLETATLLFPIDAARHRVVPDEAATARGMTGS